MNWQKSQVNLYSNHADGGGGRMRTLGQILLSDFADNISDIVALRNLDRNAADYDKKKRQIKSRLQLHTVSALLTTRSKDVPEDERIAKKTGLTQIDIDHVEQQGYDVEELKQFLFSFPFTCFVSKSCSGDGVFAIIALATTDHLKEYMKHLNSVFKAAGVDVDTSKGSNYTDLRYVSYDAKMLYRDKVEPLRIKHLPKEPTQHRKQYNNTRYTGNNSGLIKWNIDRAVTLVEQAQVGKRWPTIQEVAYTLGGYGAGLEAIEQAIYSNPAFNGEEKKYLKCAADCYKAGQLKPFY